MKMMRRAALAALMTSLVWGTGSTVSANDGTVFAGCITNRTDTSVTMDTSADEQVTIDTTWLKQSVKDILLSDCVTIQTATIDGKYVAESVEQGDDLNGNRGNSSSKDQDDNDHDSN